MSAAVRQRRRQMRRARRRHLRKRLLLLLLYMAVTRVSVKAVKDETIIRFDADSRLIVVVIVVVIIVVVAIGKPLLELSVTRV